MVDFRIAQREAILSSPTAIGQFKAGALSLADASSGDINSAGTIRRIPFATINSETVTFVNDTRFQEPQPIITLSTKFAQKAQEAGIKLDFTQGGIPFVKTDTPLPPPPTVSGLDPVVRRPTEKGNGGGFQLSPVLVLGVVAFLALRG